MAVSMQLTYEGLNEAIEMLDRVADLPKAELLDALGALTVSQTQRRITSEKTAPDGTAWPPNRQGTSTLFREGHLAGSITHNVGSDEVEVGSNLVYAAIHQEGGTIKPVKGSHLVFTVGGNNQPIFAKEVTIPQREYLGISAENEDETVDVVGEWIGRLLQ